MKLKIAVLVSGLLFSSLSLAKDMALKYSKWSTPEILQALDKVCQRNMCTWGIDPRGVVAKVVYSPGHVSCEYRATDAGGRKIEWTLIECDNGRDRN